MTLLYVGIILFVVLALGLPFCIRAVTRKRRGGVVPSLIVAAIALMICVTMSAVQVLSPGQMGMAYDPTGRARPMSVGYNFVAPWDRVYVWDMRSQSMNFTEADAADDAFGAQTKTGDYLTAIANITVRIDPDRLDAYIQRFGTEGIAGNKKTALILKSELKRAMENALSGYDTRELMNNKAKAAGEARDIAMGYLEELPFVVETLWFVDFEASAEYEQAIREQADLRMRTDKAALQASLNAQEATNNKIKADGEAEVKRIAAQADAAVGEIRAQNEAAVAKIAAERDAEVKRVQAEADAKVITAKAQASASARVAQDTAEAQGAEAIGKAYKANPELMQIKRIELEAAWAKSWNGMMPQFQGMSSFNFADLTGVLKGLLPEAAQPVSTEP